MNLFLSEEHFQRHFLEHYLENAALLHYENLEIFLVYLPTRLRDHLILQIIVTQNI